MYLSSSTVFFSAGLRTGEILPLSRHLLQREQTAQLALFQSTRNAQSARLERSKNAYPHHRTVPLRSQVADVEEPGNPNDGQVSAIVGSTR